MPTSSPKPQTRDIEAFNVVAVELSFRKAAERINIDQGTVSRRIRHLEDLLGYQLIRRTTREVSLTVAGEVFHERTKKISSDIAEAVRAAQIASEGKKGFLRVGYMSFAALDLMPRVVKEFTRRFPNVVLDLKYIRTQGQKIALSRNSIDVGFMLGPFKDSQFDKKSLLAEKLVAILPIDHKLSSQPSVKLSEIAQHPMVLGNEAEWDFFRLFIENIFAQTNNPMNIQFEASNTLGILGLVANGLGVSIYAQGIVRFQPKTIITRPISDYEATVDTLLVWNRAYKTTALKNFIAVAEEVSKKAERFQTEI